MSNVQKVSVALTPELLAMIREAIEAGGHTRPRAKSCKTPCARLE